MCQAFYHSYPVEAQKKIGKLMIVSCKPIEYGIIEKRSQISTNEKQESTVFSLLICRNHKHKTIFSGG